MYSEQEQVEILLDLLAKPAETEIVEFKRAKNSFSDTELGQYFSALSNEANLKDEAYAWLVFGVDNSTHELTDTQYKPSRPTLDEMKKKIGDQTTNRITFEEIYRSATVSHIISDTLNANLIKVENPESESRKYASYIPYYA